MFVFSVVLTYWNHSVFQDCGQTKMWVYSSIFTICNYSTCYSKDRRNSGSFWCGGRQQNWLQPTEVHIQVSHSVTTPGSVSIIRIYSAFIYVIITSIILR